MTAHFATRSERRLWSKLRRREPFWWREVRTDIWTLDFYCPHARLAVEVDGGYHRQSYFQVRDQHRDADNAKHGILTLRFTNADISYRRRRVLLEIDAVVEARTGQAVRCSWRIARRAEQTREGYAPEDELRPVRQPEMRFPAPRKPTGPDPAKALADRVRSDRWGRARWSDPDPR